MWALSSNCLLLLPVLPVVWGWRNTQAVSGLAGESLSMVF